MKWTMTVLAVALVAVWALSSAAEGNLPDEAALLERGAQIVDVRTVEEFADGHVQGAVNIPVHELSQRLGELKRDRPVVVYCRSGRRSAHAARLLEEAGFGEVHDFGPMSSWDAPR